MRGRRLFAGLGLLPLAIAQSPLVITIAVRTCSTIPSGLSRSTVLPSSYPSFEYSSAGIPTGLSSMQLPPSASSGASTPVLTSAPSISAPPSDAQSILTSQTLDPIPIPSYASGDTFTSPAGSTYQYEGDTALQGTLVLRSPGLKKRQNSLEAYNNLISCVEDCDGTPNCAAVTLLGLNCLLYGAVEGTIEVLGAQSAYNLERFEGFEDPAPESEESASESEMPLPTSTGMEDVGPPSYSTPYLSTTEPSTTGEGSTIAVPKSSNIAGSTWDEVSISEVYSTPALSMDHGTMYTPPPPTTSVLSTVLPVTLSMASLEPAASSSSGVPGESSTGSSSLLAPGSPSLISLLSVSIRSESPLVSASSSMSVPMSISSVATPSEVPPEEYSTGGPEISLPPISTSYLEYTEPGETVTPSMDMSTPISSGAASSSSMELSMSSERLQSTSASASTLESPSRPPYESPSASGEDTTALQAPYSITSAPSSVAPELPTSSSAVPTTTTTTTPSSSIVASTSSSFPASSSSSSSRSGSSSNAPPVGYSTTTTFSSQAPSTSSRDTSSSSSSPRASSSASPSSSRATSSSSSFTRSSSSSRPAAPSATPVRNTGKRGLCYTNDTLTKPYSLSGQNSLVSWGYNYYYQNNTSPNSTDFNPALDFVPLLFNDDPGLTNVWPAAAQRAIDLGADSLLGFNEPDLCFPGSACMTVNQSVRAWRRFMEPFAGKARLGAPAVTNGGPPSSLQWLGEFMGNCTGCTIDFVPIHWYSSVYAFSYLQYYVQLAYNVTGKPIWVTEFGIDNSGGSEQQFQAFLRSSLAWLDAVPFVERYSYFYNGPGFLIKNDGSGEMSAQGVIYNSYTAPCPNWQNTQGHC